MVWGEKKAEGVPGMTLFGRSKARGNRMALGRRVFKVRPGRGIMCSTVVVRHTSLERKARTIGGHDTIDNNNHGP